MDREAKSHKSQDDQLELDQQRALENLYDCVFGGSKVVRDFHPEFALALVV